VLKVRGLRRFCALYALAFLVAATVASHRHINSFQDLLSDEPSDSGIFFESDQTGVVAGKTRIGSARRIDDDPCLACFHHDYTAAVSPLFVFGERTTALQEIPPRPDLVCPERPVDSPASRAPPNRV